MAIEYSPDRNAYYFTYVAVKTDLPDFAFAKEINVDKSTIFNMRQGTRPVSPTVMLRTLQAFPPKDMEEFAEIGNNFLAQREERLRNLKEAALNASAAKKPGGLHERNAGFFDQMYGEHGFRTDTEIAQALGVSRQAINILRYGGGISPDTQRKIDSWIASKT